MFSWSSLSFKSIFVMLKVHPALLRGEAPFWPWWWWFFWSTMLHPCDWLRSVFINWHVLRRCCLTCSSSMVTYSTCMCHTTHVSYVTSVSHLVTCCNGAFEECDVVSFFTFSSLSARLSFVHPERYSLMIDSDENFGGWLPLERENGKLRGQKRLLARWVGGRSKLDNG